MTEAEWWKVFDDLGRVVRQAWVEWAHEQPNPPQKWLHAWEKLPENIKQADIKIGQAAAVYALDPLNKKRHELIHKKTRDGGLNPYEELLFNTLQDIYGECIDRIHPHSPTPEFSDHIKSLIKEMGSE